MNPIKILIYTDYAPINEDEGLHSWGITELRKLIRYKTQPLADFIVDRRYRFESQSNHLRLTTEFLSQYHELWVLCFITARRAPFELDKEEVDALSKWMDAGGGLLVAGDHAAGFCDIGNPQTFETHGRSLGEPMKRAGQLRTWVGPPTACVQKPLAERDNYNTCEGDNPEALDLPQSQSDAEAARLLTMRKPHSLFQISGNPRGMAGLIERFPDHHHESKLKPLKELNEEWPRGSSPPVIAAQVRDRRFPKENRIYPVVIAWDGPASYGRIVADSSFHHYLNINLAGIPERDSRGLPKPNSDLDQVANFYRNLALWLMPRHIRNQMKLDILFRLAVDPDVFEVRGSGYENLGRAAEYVLNLKWQQAELSWLIHYSESENFRSLDHLLASILLAENLSDGLSKNKRVLLGAIVHAYHLQFAAQGAITPDWLTDKPNPLEMIKKGIELAPQSGTSVEELLPLLKKITQELGL